MKKIKLNRKGLFGFNSKTHPRMLDARQRQVRAMELRLMGLSFQQIANSPWPIGDNKGRMYTSRMAAHKAVKREMEWAEHEKTVVYEKALAYREQHDKEAAMERELDLERLQLLLHPMMIKLSQETLRRFTRH